MAEVGNITIRILVDGRPGVARWRIVLLGRIAKLLRVPLRVEAE